jgi:hypothetical protein
MNIQISWKWSKNQQTLYNDYEDTRRPLTKDHHISRGITMRSKVEKRQEWYRKSQIIRHWIRALTLTVGVVFVVSITIPKRPIAVIESVHVSEHAIAYEVHVTDQDRAIVLGTLHVVLTSQLEQKERAIHLGYNSGIFDDLDPGVLYTFEVVASRGFGDERLASRKVETAPAREDLIWVRTDLTEKIEHGYVYYADVLLKEPIENYGDISFVIGYIFSDGNFSPHQTYLIRDGNTQVSFEVYDNNYLVVLRLLEQGGEESRVLDEKQFYPPFRLTSSVYVETVSEHSAELDLYPDYVRNIDTVFDIVLYRGQVEIERHRLTNDMVDDPYMPYQILYENLEEPSHYHIDIYATYTNPDTGIKEEILYKRIDIEPLGE